MRYDRTNPYAGTIMRRRSLYKTLLLIFVLVALSLGIVGFLLKQEPEFYVRENAEALRPEDSVQAGKVVTRLNELMEDMRSPQRGDWGTSFSAEELNALFREGESGTNPLTAELVADLPDPRVAIDGERFKIALPPQRNRLISQAVRHDLGFAAMSETFNRHRYCKDR